MQLWAIFQDLHQLRATYGRAGETFLSNAGIVQAFNVNDVETAGWISRTLGIRTVPTPRVEGRPGITGWTGRSLMVAEEIMSIDPSRMLIGTSNGIWLD